VTKQNKGETVAKQKRNRVREKSLGIRVFKVKGRPRPWGVQRRDENNKAITAFFSTAEAANAHAADLRAAKRRGEVVLMPTREELEDWSAFRRATEGHAWQSVVAGWREHLRAHNSLPCTLTCEDAAWRYLEMAEAKVTAGMLASDTVRHKRQKIGAFGNHFVAATLDTIKKEDIEAWLKTIPRIVEPGTFNNWRKHLSAFFSYWVDERIITENPVERIDILPDEKDHVGILTIRQTASLFSYALENKSAILGRIACEAFAGIRFSGAGRMDADDMVTEDHKLRIPGRKMKAKDRFSSDKFPPTVWAWLEKDPAENWTALTGVQYMHEKSDLFRDAKVPHPHNCLRHSFATYHLNAWADPGLTSTLLAHGSPKMLWKHYNGEASTKDSCAYWTITPDSAKAIATKESSK
jgi:site-specific recombinase XerD